MNFNAEQFGDLLRALRGDRPQVEVSKRSGVSQQLLSSYENGEVNSPSFVVIAKLANYYGITVNDMAVMAGLAAEPGTEEDVFPPDVARDLQDVYTLMVELRSSSKQRRFGQMLRATAERMQEITDHDDAIVASRLPSYIKRRLTSDGTETGNEIRHTQRPDGAMVVEK